MSRLRSTLLLLLLATGMIACGDIEDREAAPAVDSPLVAPSPLPKLSPLESLPVEPLANGLRSAHLEPSGSTPRSDLPPGRGRIEGVVKDPQGRPIPGARLRVFFERRVAAESTSDDKGRFSLRGLPAQSDELTIRVSARAFLPVDFQYSLPSHEPSKTDVSLTLPEGRVLVGQVVDLEGTPVTGAQVWLEWQSEEPALRETHRPVFVTGSNGIFRFPGAPRLPVEVWIWKPGIELTPRQVSAEAEDELEIVVGPQAPVFVVVEVVHADGRTPLPGAKITFETHDAQMSLSGFFAEHTSDKRGQATFGPLPPVIGIWRASYEGRALESLTDSGEVSDRLELTMTPEKITRLRFRGVDGAK